MILTSNTTVSPMSYSSLIIPENLSAEPDDPVLENDPKTSVHVRSSLLPSDATLPPIRPLSRDPLPLFLKAVVSQSDLSQAHSLTNSGRSTVDEVKKSRSNADNGVDNSRSDADSGVGNQVSCHGSSAPSKVVSSETDPTNDEADVRCQWEACGCLVSPADLLEHLRIAHVDSQKDMERFVCEWQGCKVAGRISCSMAWLERHVVSHGGLKPFRCIVPSCGTGFPSQAALHRHVNGHFPFEGQPAANNNRSCRGRTEPSNRVVRRRNKLRGRRSHYARHGDFFDCCIMDQLQQKLIDLTDKTQLGLNIPSSNGQHITFQAGVKAHRTDENGKQSFLLHWRPHDVLEDDWVAASQVENLKSILPLHHVPVATITNVHPSFYSRYRFRRQRRK